MESNEKSTLFTKSTHIVSAAFKHFLNPFSFFSFFIFADPGSEVETEPWFN